jgi:hypothetical protein
MFLQPAIITMLALLNASLTLSDPNRDWVSIDEFETTRIWHVYPTDGAPHRCTEVIVPGNHPRQFFLYVYPGPDCWVDQVMIGYFTWDCTWQFERMEGGRTGKYEWRYNIGDWDNIIPPAQTFYIRVWCVEKAEERWQNGPG